MKGRMSMAEMAFASTKSPVSAEMKYASATAVVHAAPRHSLALLTSQRIPTNPKKRPALGSRPIME